MANVVGAVAVQNFDAANVVNNNSDIGKSSINASSDLANMIGGASDLMTDISNNYSFVEAIMEHQYSVDTVKKALKTQKSLEEFSYETELVSKVASVTAQGINTLVKMQ